MQNGKSLDSDENMRPAPADWSGTMLWKISETHELRNRLECGENRLHLLMTLARRIDPGLRGCFGSVIVVHGTGLI